MKRILLYLATICILIGVTNNTNVNAHYDVYGELKNSFSHPFYYYTPTSGGRAIPNTWIPQIDSALASWGAQSSKVFIYNTSSATVDSRIYVSDGISDIADCLTFGSNSVQPHEFFYIKYSGNRKFSVSGSNDYNVKTVALHEIGHALGLHHAGNAFSNSHTKAHIMYYTYTTHKSLHAHDIEGLRSIYGY